MSEVNITEIAHQAVPYLNFADSDGNKVPGTSLSVVEFRLPDMSKTTGGFIKIDWENKDPIPVNPTSIDSVEFANSSPKDQSFSIDKEYTDTQSFTWTLNEKLTIEASKETPFAVSKLAGKTTVSFQFEFGSTQSWTKTKEQKFKISQPLIAAKHHLTKATWMLDRFDNAVLPFTAKYQLTGMVSLALLAVTGEYLWTGSVGELISAAIKGGTKNWEVDKDIAYLFLKGTLLASQGTRTYIVMTSDKIQVKDDSNETST